MTRGCRRSAGSVRVGRDASECGKERLTRVGLGEERDHAEEKTRIGERWVRLECGEDACHEEDGVQHVVSVNVKVGQRPFITIEYMRTANHWNLMHNGNT